MPYVNIRITPEGLTKEKKAALAAGATQLLAEVLGKNPASTFVIIDEIDADDWGIAGELVSDIRKRAAAPATPAPEVGAVPVITGREQSSDPRIAALIEFYRAFNDRRLDLMEQNWEQSPESSMANPVGGLKRGWEEIRGVYERIFGSGANIHVEYHDYRIAGAGDMFTAVGRERGHYQKGTESVDLHIRTSRTYRRVDGLWRQVHHHGSIDDPELLARYQAAVLRK